VLIKIHLAFCPSFVQVKKSKAEKQAEKEQKKANKKNKLINGTQEASAASSGNDTPAKED
jgi:hypothetical protein